MLAVLMKETDNVVHAVRPGVGGQGVMDRH